MSALATWYAYSGSSPLTRGKRAAHLVPCDKDGLIPAHAGKTASMAANATFTRAHPRSRGENEAAQVLAKAAAGSSPLTRGKHARRPRRVDRRRLIPAHAGKTASRPFHHCRAPAHPRSRGENFMQDVWDDCESGSSPLTRGKQMCIRAFFAGFGLIPAHAGKTRFALSGAMIKEAHPRSRGENREPRQRGRAGWGSSPLTRGKHQVGGRLRRGLGLIPAHAGKTSRARRAPGPRTAHPRSRGENPQNNRLPGTLAGSSPLTRGKLAPPRAPDTATSAHPRSRGENFSIDG